MLISSLANGISKAKNLLMSEDVIATVSAIRKLGVRVKINNTICKVHGVGIDGYKYKRGLTINAQNSGTLGRLLTGLLINSPYPIKIIGDKSLSKEIWRIAKPLKKFRCKFKTTKIINSLPLTIKGYSKFKTFSTIHIPHLKTNIILIMVLISLEIIKELPITMILRPFNFETFATQAYVYASQDLLEAAAYPSLLLIFWSTVFIIFSSKYILY